MEGSGEITRSLKQREKCYGRKWEEKIFSFDFVGER